MPPIRPQGAAQAQQPTSAARMGAGAPLSQHTGRARPAPRCVPAAPRRGPGLRSAASRRRQAGEDAGRPAAGTGRRDAVPRGGAERSCRSAGWRRGASGPGRATESRGERRDPQKSERLQRWRFAPHSPHRRLSADFLPRGGAPGEAGSERPLLAGRARNGRRRAAAGGGGEGAGRGGGGTHVLCTCRSISRISVNLSRRSMGSCSITAGTRREGRGREGGVSVAHRRGGGGAATSPRPLPGSPPPAVPGRPASPSRTHSLSR